MVGQEAPLDTRWIGEGIGELRLTAIHGAGRFDTDLQPGPDPTRRSKPPG